MKDKFFFFFFLNISSPRRSSFAGTLAGETGAWRWARLSPRHWCGSAYGSTSSREGEGVGVSWSKGEIEREISVNGWKKPVSWGGAILRAWWGPACSLLHIQTVGQYCTSMAYWASTEPDGKLGSRLPCSWIFGPQLYCLQLWWNLLPMDNDFSLHLVYSCIVCTAVL